MPSSNNDIPSNLLLNFFRKATEALWNLQPDDAKDLASHSQHRSRLLDIQKQYLKSVIGDYNNENHTTFTVGQVQEKLAELGRKQHGDDVLNEAMQASNDAARCAFARLVLYDECVYEQERSSSVETTRLLETDKPFGKAELASYASLCNAAVKLPEVQRYMKDGTPLYGEERTRTSSPQERLHHIQELLLRAVGYEPEYGKRELERLLMRDDLSDNEKELQQMVLQLNSNMSTVFQNVQLNSQAELLSDQDQGGLTRVVSVSYSEKVVDGATGQEISSTNAAPKSETMHQQQAEDRQRAQLDMARQTAALQQSILQDLMALDKNEREKRLQEAEQAHYEFLQQASQIPSGPERVAFLTSMDSKKQKLLATHKLWLALVEQNGGNPPQM